MTIKSKIYKDLTNTQRILATLEALERNDASEVKRLVECVEQKTYTQPHAEYTHGVLSQILSLKTKDKNEALESFLSAIKPREDEGMKMHVKTTVIHKRHATWPPENIGSDDIVSDEFFNSKN